MKPFEYIAATSVDHVVEVMAEYGTDASILAGGTDLLISLRRSNGISPKVIVDISRVKELNGISLENGVVNLCPLVTHTSVLRSKVLRERAKLLSSAASVIGSPQIRNRGTVGGNIMNAAACADTVPPLVALDASITLQSKNGVRRMPLADLFLEPYRTKAHADEVLTRIQFPVLPFEAKSSFIKLGRRNALTISRLSVAAVLRQNEDGKIVDARIVPGATFPTWRRIGEAEQLLIGERPSRRLFEAAGKKVSEAMIAKIGRRWSTEYKEPVIAVLVRRSLELCVDVSVNLDRLA
jgi:CO/xanthine dehydrogenase FAD-binding subunit